MRNAISATVKCKAIALVAGTMFLFTNGNAQTLSKTAALLDPSGTQYFQNQYLANAAMAGLDSGMHLNAAYRAQMNGIDGAPTTKFFSADGYIGNRVGAGLNVFNDQAGLLSRTRIAGTYAYHLPLNEKGSKLHFGISLGVNFQRLNYSKINADNNDPSIGAFNRRDDYFEADYGMAYTDQHWTIQAALPNIRATFSNKDFPAVDGGTVFFSGISYKWQLEHAVTSIEPKLCYRSIKGYDGILDVGLNVGLLNNVANVTALYHSSGNFTVGAGVRIMNTVKLVALYTKQTSGLKTYSDGGYEIGLTADLFR